MPGEILREQAARARRLARTLNGDPAAERLQDLAEELEKEARRAEAKAASDQSPEVRPG
jgi:hypothetical protein